jgi:hypothetical protein
MSGKTGFGIQVHQTDWRIWGVGVTFSRDSSLISGHGKLPHTSRFFAFSSPRPTTIDQYYLWTNNYQEHNA